MVPVCRAFPALLLALAACDAETRRERIVLVTLDTLRHDALEGASGESDMPLLRARCEGGTLFDRAFAAASTTQPTHATLLTGRHPWEHGVTRNGIVLGDEERTLAEALREHGFETHAVVAAYPLHRRFGFAQGFDSFHDDFHEAYVRQWEGAAVEGERFYSLADAVTDEALRVIELARGARQFFWFHYFDAHDPYGDDGGGDAAGGGREPLTIERLLALAAARDPAFDGTLARARELYARDVRALDRSLERLLAALEADPDVVTHVIVTADHGESFGELGCLGHGKRLVAEQLRVPLWIESPRLAAEKRDDAVGSIDVARTILAIAGVEAGSAVGGVDLSQLRSPGAVGMRRTFADARSEQLADGSRIALAPRAFFAVRDGELYTGDRTRVVLGDDPSRPAGDEAASAVAELFGGFEERLERASARELADPEIQDALQKLGYTR
jgi:arylsulfatase A-like enzyme